MLSNIMGEDIFTEGLRNYLVSNEFGNKVQDDLWDALDSQLKTNGNQSLPTDVKTIMDSWTLKMGYPVVTVQRNYGSHKVSLKQERFLMQPATRKTSLNRNFTGREKNDNLWWIYLTYTSDFKAIGSTWLPGDKAQAEISLEINAEDNQWLLFNIDEMGYYRVNYDERNWQIITDQLMANHSVISVINRAQIMDDALNLARAGLLDYDLALNLTLYLQHERAFIPWASVLTALEYISTMMTSSSSYGLFKVYVNKVLTPLYEFLQFQQKENDEHLTILTRMKVVSWACSILGNKNCTNNAIQLYSQWMEDPDNLEIVPANLKATVVCTAIGAGAQEEWDFAFERYTKSNVDSERAVLITGMSCANQPWLLTRLLEWSVSPTSGIRKQDSGGAIINVAKNPLGNSIAFNFIRDRWDELRKYFVSAGTLGGIVMSVAESYNTKDGLDLLLQFQKNYQDVLGRATWATEQTIDQIRNNLYWMTNNQKKVAEWLQRI